MKPREFWIEFPKKPDSMISTGRVVSTEDFEPLNDEFCTAHVIEKSAYDALLAQAEEMARALEFYRDEKNWQHGIAYSQNNLMIESDMYCIKGHHLYAGKTAKDALGAWEKFRKGEG